MADRFTAEQATVAGLALALLLLLGALLDRTARPPAIEPLLPRLGRGATLLLLAVAVAAAIPPFGPFGLALLGGGCATLLAVAVGRRVADAGFAGLAGLAVAGVPSELALPAAAGVSLGAWLVCLAADLPVLWRDEAEASSLSTAALLAATACGAAFGTTREAGLAAHVAPLSALALGVVSGGLSPFGARLAAALPILQMLLAAGLAWAVASATRISEPVIGPIVLGLAAGWLQRGLRPAAGDPAVRLRDGLLAALVLLGTGAVAFAWGRGLGLALTALATAATLTPAEERPARTAHDLCLAGLCGWVMLRLLHEHATIAGRCDLFDPAVLLGLAAGLLGPMALGPAVANAFRRGPAAGAARRIELLLVGVAATVAPAVVVLLVLGAPAVAGVAAAGLLGPLLLLVQAPLVADLPAAVRRLHAGLPAAYATLAAAATPVALSLAPFSHWSRRARALVLAVLVLAAVGYLAARPGLEPAEGDSP